MYIDKNNKKVSWLRVYATLAKSWLSFVLVMILMIGLWAATGVALYRYNQEYYGLFGFASLIAIAMAAFGFIFNEPLVVLSTKAKRVKTAQQAEEMGVSDFWNDIHEISQKAGLWKVPRIYIIPSSSVNACAFGWGLPYFSAVAATEGITRKLSKEQLKAVMSHEIAHIKNKDIIIAVTLVALITFFAVLSETIPRAMIYGGSSSKSKSKNSGLAGLVAIIIIMIAAVVIRFIVGPLLQMFISRQREYGADALGAKIMGSSKPLSEALEIISDMPTRVGRVKSASSLFFCRASAAGEDGNDLFSTHPTTDNRLRALAKLEE